MRKPWRSNIHVSSWHFIAVHIRDGSVWCSMNTDHASAAGEGVFLTHKRHCLETTG
jgi:hypothetical protein